MTNSENNYLRQDWNKLLLIISLFVYKDPNISQKGQDDIFNLLVCQTNPKGSLLSTYQQHIFTIDKV